MDIFPDGWNVSSRKGFVLCGCGNQVCWLPKSMAAYQAKWKGHQALKRQFGFFYRYFGVFVEHGKWRRLLRHPILAAVMCLERIAVGFTYLLSR